MTWFSRSCGKSGDHQRQLPSRLIVDVRQKSEGGPSFFSLDIREGRNICTGMNWVNSAAARAGLGPPEWLVIAIILSLLFAASFEHRRGVSSTRTLVLTRTDKLVVT